MKKIAIIGAGISGLFVANLFSGNSDYQLMIYEKNNYIQLDEGYGIQLSINSIKLLNKIGFNNLNHKDQFNPEKIDFYDLKNQKKICELNISKFNTENCKYTALKRSKLINFLKDRLDQKIINYGHNIQKIEKKDDKVVLTFNENNKIVCDILIISDGVFSKGKSLISNYETRTSYNQSIAIRGNISGNNLDSLNERNISLFLGNNFHYVLYRLNQNDDEYNFIGILNHRLTTNELGNYSLFKEKEFIKGIKDRLKNKISSVILDNFYNIKCFPVFVSKGFLKPGKNIFLIGDAFYAFPPSFAQGASQSIESGFELFESITNNKNNFYDNRVLKIQMVNNRSKLNQFAFHLSNPIMVFLRNFSMKILTKNKKFLESYLGRIYKN